jgi:hypothetical protein
VTAPEKKSVRRWWASIRDGAERHNLFADKTRADMETVAGPFANRQTIEFVLAADYDAERRAAEEVRSYCQTMHGGMNHDGPAFTALRDKLAAYVALDAAVTEWVNSERGVDLWTVADRSTPEAKVADALAALHVALALDQLTDAPIEDKYLIVTLRARDGEKVYTRTTRCYEWKEWKPFMAGSTAEKMFEELLAALDQPATTEEK